MSLQRLSDLPVLLRRSFKVKCNKGNKDHINYG